VVRSGPSLKKMVIGKGDRKWKKGRPYLVGYLGVIGRQEGIDHLLEAIRILVRDRGRTDIQFVIVGGGTELNAMQLLAKHLQIETFVTFTGRAPDEIVLDVLNAADLCVNPDIPNEMNDKSTMNKIMEYMALGKPIVQYDLTEGRVTAQEASLYARPNDRKDFAAKIEQLLENPEERMRRGDFGRKRVLRELHWGVEAPKYLSVYEQIKVPEKRRIFSRRTA
jgi:glycosyltransferase involved in cell wall biosynthesis